MNVKTPVRKTGENRLRMNILVTGADGQLGSELRNIADSGAVSHRFIFTDVSGKEGSRTEYLDITDADAVIPPEYMTTGIWRLSSMLEPYGQENAELRLYIKDAVISDIIPSKQDQKFMRFSLRFGTYAWPAVWWAPHDRESFRKGMHVNAVFTPDINFWKGTEKEQLLIVEMEEAADE